MADTKISALTVATTPLAGTEVLPIVQSGATVKVTNNDLRPKQIQSNATSGVMQVAGPAAASTRVMTIPDANFTAARTDAGQTFTGAQVVNSSTFTGLNITRVDAGASSAIDITEGDGGFVRIACGGGTSTLSLRPGGTETATLGTDLTISSGNLVQGTAAKGINFTANTPASGMTSQLLNWYEEGTWTPALSASTPGNFTPTYTVQEGGYTRVGRLVTAIGRIYLSSFTNTTGSGDLFITGLPFTASGYYSAGGLNYAGVTKAGYTQFTPFATPSQTYLRIDCSASATALATLQVTDLTGGGSPYFLFTVTYQV